MTRIRSFRDRCAQEDVCSVILRPAFWPMDLAFVVILRTNPEILPSLGSGRKTRTEILRFAQDDKNQVLLRSLRSGRQESGPSAIASLRMTRIRSGKLFPEVPETGGNKLLQLTDYMSVLPFRETIDCGFTSPGHSVNGTG